MHRPTLHSAPDEPDRLISAAELAARLQIARRTVYDMARRGVIRALRVGGRRGALRFHLAEALAALAQRDRETVYDRR